MFLLKKVLIIISCILSVAISLSIYNNLFSGYNYGSDLDCIKYHSFKNHDAQTIVFKYENKKREIILFNTQDNFFYNCILDKKQKNGKTMYRLNCKSNTPPITYHTEWTEVDKNLRYIFVDYENDIEDIDCQGFEPIGTKIYYTIANGEQKSCWIYIIDESVT